MQAECVPTNVIHFRFWSFKWNLCDQLLVCESYVTSAIVSVVS